MWKLIEVIISLLFLLPIMVVMASLIAIWFLVFYFIGRIIFGALGL